VVAFGTGVQVREYSTVATAWAEGGEGGAGRWRGRWGGGWGSGLVG